MSWLDTDFCGSKINLRLKVTSRREDGFHELSTLFLPLDFPGDIVEISENSGGVSLEVPGFPELAAENNLAVRAAKLYAEKSGIVPQWDIVLHKKAPIAAGLGGGSADGAGVLRLLNRRYGMFGEKALADMALTLGADCPFFLHRKPAWAEGIGEQFSLIDQDLHLPETVIVYPGFPTSAKWAYTHLSKELISPEDADIKERFAQAFSAPETADWQSLCRNDLAPAVFGKFPLLEILREKLFALGAAAVQLSGSGSSLFALFFRDAATAAASLAAEYRDFDGMRIFTGGEEF